MSIARQRILMPATADLTHDLPELRKLVQSHVGTSMPMTFTSWISWTLAGLGRLQPVHLFQARPLEAVRHALAASSSVAQLHLASARQGSSGPGTWPCTDKAVSQRQCSGAGKRHWIPGSCSQQQHAHLLLPATPAQSKSTNLIMLTSPV